VTGSKAKSLMCGEPLGPVPVEIRIGGVTAATPMPVPSPVAAPVGVRMGLALPVAPRA
jgi:hypothetical protein